MSIETHTVVPNKLFHHTVKGYVVVADIKTYQDAFWTENENLDETVNTVWDLRNADLSNLSFAAIDNYAENVLQSMFIPYKAGRTVILMNDTPEKHLITYLGNAIGKAHNRELTLFTDYDQAFSYADVAEASA